MSIEAIKRIRQDCLKVLSNKHSELNSLKNSNLVIIGGTGFVGTWIAEMVSALNDSFEFKINLSLISRNIDQFSNNFPHITNRPDITLIKSDVRTLINFPSDANWVIHAAANPDVRTHATDPIDTASVIVDGTNSVLKTVSRLGFLKKLLYLSSGLVNSSQSNDNKGIKEDSLGAPTPEASFIYPNAKRFAETLCSASRLQSRIPIVIARPFSFIGPYQSLKNPWAQTTFLSDAIKGRQIRVQGDGKIIRSYLYGSDAAYWFLKILVDGCSGDIVNVGSPETVNLKGLAEKIGKNFNNIHGVIFNTVPKNKLRSENLFPDISNAKRKYGLTSFTSLDEAIKLTIDWHLLQNNS